MGTVVVVGSINRDVTVRVPTIPAPGETVLGGDPSEAWGGKGANQAVAAASAGARVVMIGAVGDDDDGRGARADLERHGVDATLVSTTGRPTGAAFIAVDAEGENAIVVAPGANQEVVVPADVDPAGEGDAVVLASFEVPDAAVTAAARLARERGWPLVVNPAPARPLPADVVEANPIVVPNRGELALLSGESTVEPGARVLAERTGAPVVVTLGGDGVLVVDGSTIRRLATPPVDVVDTTGAGDAFCGTFAAALAAGADLATAVDRAVEAGAATVRHLGARQP